MSAKRIMVQGTMSNSGKSFLTAALCRILFQDGLKTAPFKSQNMALNSFVTMDGLEIGRAQAMQAEAAGVEPCVDFNPILLKPTTHMGSQVILRGEVSGNWRAADYYRDKLQFLPVVRQAWNRVAQEYEAVVIEGAGSPAEINLREHDFVNMGLAQMTRSPVILVGDIDRGGVFASLYGTVKLLEPEEQRMIKGLVINKFRGDLSILEPGLRMIEEKTGIPVLGVIPMEDIDLDDEDSLANEPGPSGVWRKNPVHGQIKPGDSPCLDIAVIRLPRISNFTDFQVFCRFKGVCLRYVDRKEQLGQPDLILIPGTKNTMEDLIWMRARGLEEAILRQTSMGVRLIGICGGYQMLGKTIRDPYHVEGAGVLEGMGLLDMETEFHPDKTRTRIQGKWLCCPGWMKSAPNAESSGLEEQDFAGPDFGQRSRIISEPYLSGYEIHMGQSRNLGGCVETVCLEDGRRDGFMSPDGRVWGSYLHGLFDTPGLAGALLGFLAKEKGVPLEMADQDWGDYKQSQYNKLADLVRGSLDMEAIYRMLNQSGDAPVL